MFSISEQAINLKSEIMAYKLEHVRNEHELALKETLDTLRQQEHDLMLLSSDGHRINTHRTLLSFYSSHLKKMLNDPVISYSANFTTISVPAPAKYIFALLKILQEGKATSSDEMFLKEVVELSNIFGIHLDNCNVINELAGCSTPIGVGTSKTNSQSINPSSFLSVEINEFDSDLNADRECGTDPSDDIIEIEENVLSKMHELDAEELIDGNYKSVWKCDICGKPYREKRFMQRHQRRFHGITKRDAKEALMRHIGERKNPNVCPFCNRMCKDLRALKEHVKRRHTDRSYCCDECPKSFKNSNELKQHQITHLPDEQKPFECEFCNKKFCQKGQMTVHVKRYHSCESDPLITDIHSISMSNTYEDTFEITSIEEDGDTIKHDVDEF